MAVAGACGGAPVGEQVMQEFCSAWHARPLGLGASLRMCVLRQNNKCQHRGLGTSGMDFLAAHTDVQVFVPGCVVNRSPL